MPILQTASRALMEGMSDVNTSRDVYMSATASVIAFVLAVIIIALIGQFLWNNAVVELVSVAKPAKSFLHILGLMFMVNLLLP